MHRHLSQFRPGLAGGGLHWHGGTDVTCSLVLAVLAVVVVPTVAHVAVGGGWLLMALGVVLAGVQLAGIGAAFTIVTCTHRFCFYHRQC